MGNVEQLPSGRAPYLPPRLIEPDDRFENFDCGEVALDDFLKGRALKNEGKASRTYVICSAVGEDAGAVVAYYTLASGAITHDETPPALKRNMPNPLPIMILGRMAVDNVHHGKGLGRAMLKEAMQRVLDASRSVGARALVVHAVSDEAVTFYTQYGFQVFPTGTRTLFLPIETIAKAL